MVLHAHGAVGEAIYFAAIKTILTQEPRHEGTTLSSGLLDNTALRNCNPFVVLLPVTVAFLREPTLMLLRDFAVAGPVISAQSHPGFPLQRGLHERKPDFAGEVQAFDPPQIFAAICVAGIEFAKLFAWKSFAISMTWNSG